MQVLEKVYPLVRQRLWRFIYSLARNPDLTEDLFQSAFEKTIPAVESGRLDETSVVPYLFQVARNEFLNHVRKTKRETALESGPEPAAGAPDQSDRIQIVILAFLEGPDLGERERAVLRLRLLGELSADEIAATLEVSRRTVYRELRAGLDGLRAAFEAAGLTPGDLE